MSDQASAPDPYVVVLADLRAKREQIDQLIQSLETMRGFGSGHASSAYETPAKSDTKNEPLSSGAFLGMSIAEGTKRLLSVKRMTLNNVQIAQGLAAGGLHLTGSEPANAVGSVLSRRFSSVGDIVRVSRGQWGLAEWYPNRSFRKKPAGKDTPGGLIADSENLDASERLVDETVK